MSVDYQLILGLVLWLLSSITANSLRLCKGEMAVKSRVDQVINWLIMLFIAIFQHDFRVVQFKLREGGPGESGWWGQPRGFYLI